MDESIIEMVSDKFDQDANAQIGSGGTKIFELKTKDLGDAFLLLRHWRYWEGSDSVQEEFSLFIKVRSRN